MYRWIFAGMSYFQVQSVISAMSIFSFWLYLLNIWLHGFLVTTHYTSAIISLSSTILNVNIMFLQNIQYMLRNFFISCSSMYVDINLKNFLELLPLPRYSVEHLGHTSRTSLFAGSLRNFISTNTKVNIFF